MKLGLEKVPVHVAKDSDAGASQSVTGSPTIKPPNLPSGILSCCRSSWLSSRRLDFDLNLLGFGEDELAKLLTLT